MIYNSPYYGFETKADLFFDLRREFPNLVGFKDFGGADSLSYAVEHITHADINDKSCMALVGEYNPPDSGFAYKKLNIVPRKPSFYK